MGLSGLSVGLGAWMPNFRETDPSKIAVGFGGTLNLVVGLLFLMLVIGSMAAPYHIVRITHAGEPLPLGLSAAIVAGVGIGIGLGACAVLLPLRRGFAPCGTWSFDEIGCRCLVATLRVATSSHGQLANWTAIPPGCCDRRVSSLPLR